MRRQTQQLRRRKLPNNYDIKNINSHFTKATKTTKPMTGLINHVNSPTRSSKLPVGSDYMSLAENLNQFKDLGIVPMDLDVEKLNQGIGIQKTLMIHSAKWHKTCSLKFNK